MAEIVALYGSFTVTTLTGHTALSTAMLAVLFRALFRLAHPMAPLYRSMWMVVSATPDRSKYYIISVKSDYEEIFVRIVIKMKIYLIRHGESEGNKADVRQFPDMPLSEKGRSQASAIANRLSPLHFDKIMSSPFPRALDTAKKIGEKLSLQVETSELLIEVKKPSETWGMSHDEIQKHPHTSGFITNLHDPYWKYSDEENVFEFRSRVEKCLELFANCGSENIIVVTHGAVIRFIMAMVMLGKAISPQNFFAIYQKTQTANTGVTIIEYESGQWNLISFNDHAHLW